MKKEAQVVPREQAVANVSLRLPCQFGIVDDFSEKGLADFTKPGIVIAEKHPILPPLFWEYTVLDEKGQLIFTSKRSEKKLSLDNTIEDPWGDGVCGRLDCLFTTHCEEIPAGMTLSYKRDLWDSNARQLEFRRMIRGIPMSWGRLVTRDQAQEYFRVSFGGSSQDTVHLRALTDSEKKFAGPYPFGLFLSSEFRYPLKENRTWIAETIVGYTLDSPWAINLNNFFVGKIRGRSFGKSRWQELDAYQQPQDVFIISALLGQTYEKREYARKPFEEVVAEISSETPDSLSWKAFQLLFSFHSSYSAGRLYGERGALQAPPKKNKK